MLFGITWWGSLFVLLTLLVIAMELTGLTDDEDDEPTTVFDYLNFYSRLILYMVLIVLVFLYFQPLDGSYLATGLASFVLIAGAIIVLTDIVVLLKSMTKKSTESEGKMDIAISIFSNSLMYVFYGCGMAIAYSTLQKSIGLFT